MYENLINSDIFYYLLTAIFGGLVFVYAIKKLLSLSYSSFSKNSSLKSDSDLKNKDRNHPNDEQFKNGRVPKLNGTLKYSNSLNNNESEESEVNEINEEIVKNKKCLDCESTVGSNHSISTSDVESNDKTSEDEPEQYDKEEVHEIVTKTDVYSLKSEKELQKLSDLAAIIITDDNRNDWFEIICITSGSDVIDARNLKPEFVVVDCRAPVLARRSLIRYLYHKLNQLIKQEVKEEESLFSPIPASNRFEVKKNFKFSLFLSDPPDNCQTKPKNGISKRDSHLVRLKSTTDKISVWNQVGIQGSLLSHFIDAIFISSVIIPVEFNQKSFHQHFIHNYTKEPKLLKANNNLITDITDQIKRVRVNNDQSLATNWIKTEDVLEIIDCKSGKAIKDMATDCGSDGLFPSRLSKHELNKCFRDFLTNYEYNLRPHQSLPMTYRKWKESAPNYRIQKQLLKVRYAVAGRQWICLPSDLDLFV